MMRRSLPFLTVLPFLMTSGLSMAKELIDVDGVRLIHVENHDVEIVFAEVAVEAGSLLDPEGKEGLANMAARMLLRGTKKRTYQKIMDEVNDLGATLDTAGRKEFIGVHGDFMPRYLDQYASIMADVLGDPTFPEKDFEHERSLVLEDLLNLRNDDADLARHFFSRFLYRGHPLGRPNGGYLKSIGGLKASDCRDFYRKHFRKGNIVVVVAGAIDQADAIGFVRKVTAGVPAGPRKRATVPPPPDWKGVRVLIVDKPERTQTQVMLGHPSLGWSDRDLFPVLVGNTAFGGTFTSRLMREIREKRGWSYGVSSFITAGRKFGTMAIRFFPANKDTVPAIQLTLDLLKELVKKGLSDEETGYAKNHIANQFPFRLETARKRAAEKLADELYSRPGNYIRDYVKNVRQQATGSINAALTRWYSPDDIAVVVVGTAADLLEDVKKIPGVASVEVHPYDKDQLPATGSR